MLNSRFGGYFRVLAFALIITTFLPLLYENLPRVIHSYHLYAAIWFVSILFLSADLLLKRHIGYLLFYAFITLVVFYYTVWAGVNEWNWTTVRFETYYVMAAVTLLAYFVTSGDYDGLASLVKWALVFIGITAIMSIYATFKDPTYARSMTAGELGTVELGYFRRLGAGNYSFAEALVCLFPMMVYFFKENEKSIFSRKVIFVYGVICFYALLRMQIITDILFAFLLFFISLLGSKRRSLSISLVAVFLVAFYLIPNSFYSDVALRVSSYFSPTSIVYSRLHDLSMYFLAGQYAATEVGSRAARYPLLLSGFERGPLLGYYYATTRSFDISEGGHLYWMNKLAVFGLVGLLLYAKIHVDHLVQTVKTLDKDFTFYFLVAALGGLGMGLAKNIVGREFWYTYFVILPGLQYLPLLKRSSQVLENGYEDMPLEVRADE